VPAGARAQGVFLLEGFSLYQRDDLDGCCASGLWEAWLARDYFQKHVVTYSPAYDEADVAELCGSPIIWISTRFRSGSASAK
jgi:hypothetical protein